VHYDIQDHIAIVTMDDGKVNAFGHDAIVEMNELLDRSVEAGALVIAGRPGVFSAGFDRTIMLGEDNDDRLALATAGAKLVARLYGLPIPVVIACTGHAIALGAILLMSGDVRVGAQGEFQIGMNEVAIGLALPHWALALANARLDRKQLQQATLGATMYSPEGAKDVGYLDEITEPGVTVEHAIDHAVARTKLSRGAYKYTKANLRATDLVAIEDFIEERQRTGM